MCVSSTIYFTGLFFLKSEIIFNVSAQQGCTRQETQGGHFAVVDQELGDDVDDEHAQEVERLDDGHAAGAQVRHTQNNKVILSRGPAD